MEANDASLVSGDATSRAQELRASLGARQVAETLLAEAGKIRQDAAVAADAMVEEAQKLSEQLLAESRRAAEQVAAEARQRADAVLTQARAEAEQLAAEARQSADAALTQARAEAEQVAAQARASADALRTQAEAEIEEHRRRVRAEVTAQVTQELTEQHRAAELAAREESEALVSDLEASVRILGVSLESARANVGELLGSLEAMRPTATTSSTGVDQLTPERPPPSVPRSGGAHLVDTPFGLEPLSASTTSVPTPSSPFGVEADDEAPASADRPRSATEAFLSSSSMEIEQASRELRDLQNPDEARRRRGDESRLAAERRELDAGAPSERDETDETDEAARPLGWLFRTAHQ
jgi:hypothetical protein